MAMHHATVRKHATATEWAFLETSFASALVGDAVTPARLRQRAARARKLRDKYRDTDAKAKEEMFADAVVRIEARLAQLEPKHATPAVEAMRAEASEELALGVGAPAETPADAPWLASEAAEATKMRAQSDESRGVRQQQMLSHQSGLAHQAHVGSRGRRNQGLRDSR